MQHILRLGQPTWNASATGTHQTSIEQHQRRYKLQKPHNSKGCSFHYAYYMYLEVASSAQATWKPSCLSMGGLLMYAILSTSLLAAAVNRTTTYRITLYG